MIFVAVGLALFVFTLWRTGLDEILGGLGNLGWGFAAILALSGTRFLCRACAWRRCLRQPEQLSVLHALGTVLIGDAAGNLTPFGPLASESTKIAGARSRLSLVDTVSSIALEDLFYSLSVCLVISAGCAALLLRIERLPDAVRLTALGGILLFCALAVLIAGLLIARIPVITSAVGWLARRGWLPRAAAAKRLQIERLEQQFLEFTRLHRDRLPEIVAWEAAYHGAAVAEAAVALTLLLGVQPGVATAFIFEAVNRLITVVFKFVPLRMGVDEAGTSLLATALGLNAPVGVTLAIVRKLRVLTWNGVGLATLAAQRLRPQRE